MGNQPWPQFQTGVSKWNSVKVSCPEGDVLTHNLLDNFQIFTWDNREPKQTDAAAERRRSLSNVHSIQE